MKLQYLWVGRFKNLVDFEVDFSPASIEACTVVLGRNGLGKSNLLEVLVVIFRDLYLGKPSPFSYRLRYTLKGGQYTILINNRIRSSENKALFHFSVTDADGIVSRIPLSNIRKTKRIPHPEGWKYLPRHVFAYYSGPSDRLEEHFRPHQRMFYKDLLDGKDSAFRPLFYARPIHSNFVLLAFYTRQDKAVDDFLKSRLRIEGFESALFVLRRPKKWADKRPDGDIRFWRAIGTVQHFLSKLWQVALAPMRLAGTIADQFGKPQKTQFLYLLIPNLAALLQLAKTSSGPVDFFKELESTYISDVIHETRIRVRVRNCDGSLTFRELSEGEQQLLMVVGLLRFTREGESLFLLDEPDTHLNPAWGMEYLTIIKEMSEMSSDSQVVIATHDALMISGLSKEQVIVLEREPGDLRIGARHPEVDPRGLGLSGILKSSMFGLSTTLDLATQAKLDERFRLAAQSERNPDEQQRLIELSRELANAGFAQDFRDDNYDRFAKAVAKLREENKLDLSREEINALENRALDAVREVLKEEGAE